MENVNFKINTVSSPVRGFLAIAVGLLCIFASDLVLKYIVVLIGFGLVLSAAISLAATYKGRQYNNTTFLTIRYVEGCATAIFGLILVGFPAFFISMLMVLLAILLLLASVDQFSTLARVRKVMPQMVTGWSYVVPTLILLASIAILINPFAWAEFALIVIFGATLLAYGVFSLFSYFAIKQRW